MAVARQRYRVTETPAVARALDLAALRWPGEPRSRLLLRLLDLGGAVLEGDPDDTGHDHEALVRASAGRYAAAFGPGYLSRLRDDWPA